MTADSFLAELKGAATPISDLLRPGEPAQASSGYFHTLREILQQPDTWVETAAAATANIASLRRALEGVQAMVLTGSGSSLYVGECLSQGLQAALGIPVQALSGGHLLTYGAAGIPPRRPALIVSLARSGDSPESHGAVSLFLDTEPECRHLMITCNRQGRLATGFASDPRVFLLSLADRTCDRSLVMTSSFTNMVVAGRLLAMVERPGDYSRKVERLASMARHVLLKYPEALARIAGNTIRSAVYLGDGCRFGAAREASLKMQEMTGGAVCTFPENYLGLRHGPMSSVHEDTLVVCYLANDPLARAYELDLIRELNRKNIAAAKIIVGENIPAEVLKPQDVALECPGMAALEDEDVPVIDVLVGQLLAFFQCRARGLKPDAPSSTGVISRVVNSFQIHRREATA
jgi:tagatose-6-phosphate ketose/aldose isomerase